MKFRKIDGQLCMSPTAIAEAIGGDMSKAYNLIRVSLHQLQKRDSAARYFFEDEKDGRKKWLIVDKLPADMLSRVHSHYGADLQACYHRQRLYDDAVGLILHDDAEWFLGLNQYTVQQAGHLAEACGWLRLVSGPAWWQDRFSGKMAAMVAAATVISARGLYGFRVNNARVLDRRAQAWLKDGRNSLVSGKIGNGNAAKAPIEVMQSTIQARIVDLYASALKPTVETVAAVYNREAAEKGWPVYSTERIRQILNAPKTVQTWVAARHGVNAARAETENSLRRRRPSHPDALWSVDGTTVQLYSTEDGKEYQKAWYIITVTDAYSDCVIGWACGTTETSTLVLRALRKAVSKSGHSPSVAQFDGSKANTSDEVTQLWAHMHSIGIKAQPYNGKSKYVERVQGWIEQHFQRYMNNFVGGNITARSLNTRANPDHLLRQLKAGEAPDAQRVLAQVALAVEAYNNTIVKARDKTPEQLYSMPDERRRKAPYLTQVSWFWVKRNHLVRYTKDGIRMEVEKERYFYEVQSKPGLEDYEFRQEHLGDSFIVRYDPDNLNEINLYDKQDRWVATARTKHAFGAVPEEWEEGEGSVLRESLEQRKRYIHDGLKAREAIRAQMAEQGAEELSFEMIHKDALNRAEDSLVKRLLTESGMDQAPAPRGGAKRPLYYDEDQAKRLLNDD